MLKVVIDTNVLVASIAKKSPFRIIFDALLTSRFKLLISNEIFYEYLEIISRKTNSVIAINFNNLIHSLQNVHFIEIYYKWNLIRKDEDDNKFVDCAISGNADYIVTEDKHFEVLKEVTFPPLKIIGIKEFISILEELQ